MTARHWTIVIAGLLTALTGAASQQLSADKDLETGAFGPAQAAADVLREVAGTDGAFLAAALLKSNFDPNNLATLLQYPDNEIAVVAITGAKVRQAFERSISLYPQPNSSFLQISGFEVTFDPKAAPGSRVVSVTANGLKLDDAATYKIAMPSSLGRGGLGYFKIWDKPDIVSSLPNMTVESALKGKKVTETRPRWVSQ